MQDTTPSGDKMQKYTDAIAKNPLAFVAAGFFLMFWITYFINVYGSKDECDYWKDQYEAERGKNDKLMTKLLIKNGIIENQKEINQLQDSMIREITIEPTLDILNEYENLETE